MDIATIPDVAKTPIATFLSLLDIAFPQRITGFYLTGSIALGDFHHRQSDIDFVAVTDVPFKPFEFAKLSKIHRCLERSHHNPTLDGIYVTWHQLVSSPEGITVPYSNEGVFHPSNGFGANPVTWSTLSRYPVAIRGPRNPSIFHDDKQLRNWCRLNLLSYWSRWIRSAQTKPKRIVYSLSRHSTEWGVLGVSRLHATINMGDIISKEKAGQYALSSFPVQWHRVIQSSLLKRAGEIGDCYTNPFRRRRETLAYMSMIVSQATEV